MALPADPRLYHQCLLFPVKSRQCHQDPTAPFTPRPRRKQLYKRPLRHDSPILRIHRPAYPLKAPITESSTEIIVKFRITRTDALQLPVYLDISMNGTRIRTEIRRIEGDVDEFVDALQTLLGPQAIIEKKVGKVLVKGNYRKVIYKWLEVMGF